MRSAASGPGTGCATGTDGSVCGAVGASGVAVGELGVLGALDVRGGLSLGVLGGVCRSVAGSSTAGVVVGCTGSFLVEEAILVGRTGAGMARVLRVLATGVSGPFVISLAGCGKLSVCWSPVVNSPATL